jgi:hypothetical protein
MDTSTNPEQIALEPKKPEEKFFPSGAIAFFILLIILSLDFWYGIYFLMIQRS